MGDAVLETALPKITSRIAQIVAEQRVPGLSAGIVRDQELAWSGGFGFADIETERRPDEHTLYRVGSITKTFTASALVQLRDAGKLSLDDPVVKHIAEFGSVHNPYGPIEDVTLKRLLTHRSGLVGEPPTRHWETLSFPSMEEITGSLGRVQVAIEPDSAFKYSNLAFALLGEVVTRASGRAYTEYVQTEILDPLGMSSSTFDLTDDLRPRVATGYDPNPFADETPPAPHPHINGETAAGQLYSTVADLARWIALQFRTDAPKREGAQVLPGRSLAEMHRPLYMEPDWNGGYCLSWMAMRRGDNIYLGHGGGIHGFVTQVLFNIPRRTGAIALTNSGGGPAGMVAVEMMETLMAAEKDAPKVAPARTPVPMPKEWTRFLGLYARGGGIVRIECREGTLLGVVPAAPDAPPLPPARLEPTEQPETFMVRGGRWSGEPLTFRLNEAGAVTGFAASGFTFNRLAEVT